MIDLVAALMVAVSQHPSEIGSECGGAAWITATSLDELPLCA
jgi:hypothetical protein